ncbi:protocadherin gamma-C5-like [Engraulis encrasicolus]|uniref:protocadherin gamma-C5-like n=1 Tax=Engraulis encrasicolus TaxID=184585 RepID=UPI002FCEE02E
MSGRMWIWLVWRQSLFLSIFHLTWNYADGQTRYTIPEELKRGSVVGNILKDLELQQSEVSERRLRISSEDGKQYFSVDLRKGDLLVNERIDREALCGQNPSCVLPLQVLIEDPLQLFTVEVDIQDINDNFPVFITPEHVLNIAESTTVGTRFPLKSAEDLDVGANALKSYKLSPNEHFVLNLKSTKSGVKVPELVLQKHLDREKQSVHQLALTAVDGGYPPRSGTTQIAINVLDINDNAPKFGKLSYEVKLREDAMKDSTVVAVNAVDLDGDENGDVSYSFAEHTSEDVLNTFVINPQTGVVSLGSDLDYEQKRKYEFDIRATDKGSPPMEGHCTVIVDVQDVNDNPPEIIITSLMSPLKENSPVGTVVALITPKDNDSGLNGKTTLTLAGQYPFKLSPSLSGHFALVTDAKLDRESFPQYNIKIIVSDSGSPPLHDEKVIVVDILDTNDSPPKFSQSEYTAFVKENTTPGTLICSVSARDPDAGENAKISYSILESGDSPVSYVYINPDNGSIYSSQTFDYELLTAFKIHVQATDRGSPPLSSNTTVNVFIVDENDNAPLVIHPSVATGSPSQQKMPRSAKAGHLVTKVTAVDADSGRNAWISYRLTEATDDTLFVVNVYTGEVRTRRAVYEDDESTQTLLVEIRDNGDPAQSATATVSILLEDGLHEAILDQRNELSEQSKKGDQTQFYLLTSLACMSLLSTVTCLLVVVKCAKRAKRGSSACCMRRMDSDDFINRNIQLQLNTDGPIKYVEVLGGDVVPRSQSFRSSFLSPVSEYGDLTLIRPHSTLDFRDMMSMLDASLPDNAWTFESQQVSSMACAVAMVIVCGNIIMRTVPPVE